MNAAQRVNTTDGSSLVTVVLPAYAMGRYISEALESVAAQTHKAWEVIVVDDQGPEDGTAAIVQEFAARMTGHRVELVRHGHNQGVSAARNSGINAAKGTYVAFLDPDDSFLPHHLAAAVALLEGGAFDVAAGPVESFSEDPNHRWTHKAWIDGWRADHFPHSLAVYNFIQPSAVVVRRSAVMAVGGFDTTPALQHIEDFDLWIRLVNAGHRFAFMERISARYRKHAGGATSHDEKFRVLHALLYTKHPDFFREGMRRMMRVAHEDLAKEEELRRGPLMRGVLWFDGLWMRLFRKLGIIQR